MGVFFITEPTKCFVGLGLNLREEGRDTCEINIFYNLKTRKM